MHGEYFTLLLKSLNKADIQTQSLWPKAHAI